MGCCESTHAVATENTIAKKPNNIEKVIENVSNDQENGNAHVVMEQEKENVLKNEEINLVENKTDLDNASANEDIKEGDDDKEDVGPVLQPETETQCETLEVALVEKEEPVKENKEEEIAIVPPTEPEEATIKTENMVAVSSHEETVLENIEENALVVPSADSEEEATIEKYEENAAEETINEMKKDVLAPEPEEAIEEKEDESVEMVPSPIPEITGHEKEEENEPVVSSPVPEEKKVKATIVLEPETVINVNEREPEASETVESISEQENTSVTNQKTSADSAAEEAKTN